MMMNETKMYVLGFMFSESRKEVLLIEKQKPQWQKGLLNGVGGKIEPTDDSALHAMIREFKEETGVDMDEWTYFARMTFNNDIMGGRAMVFCFKSFSDKLYSAKSMEIERVGIVTVEDLSYHETIDNLPFLIPIALHNGMSFAELEY